MLLIDRYVPVADFSETHVLAVEAPAESVLAAAVAFRPDDDILFRRLMALRELPMRLARVFGRTDRRPPRPFGFDDFTLLERGPREVVYGLAGRFWRSDFGLSSVVDASQFLLLAEPGIAKLAMNFAARPTGPQTCELQTQTRVFCMDARARSSFAPYWYLIRPVSGLIRRRTLAAIRTASEAGSLSSPA